MISGRETELNKRAMIKLANMGGFIGDVIRNDIREKYNNDDAIINTALKYCGYKPVFFTVADMLDKIKARDRFYVHNENHTDETEEYVYDSGYCKWYLDQVARIFSKKVMHPEEPVWRNWDLSHYSVNTMEAFNALEEHVFLLSTGVDSGYERSAEQIALMDEFACSTVYIEQVLHDISVKLKAVSMCDEEILRYCENERAKKLEHTKTKDDV